MSFSVYILKSARDGRYYVGQTKNLDDRLRRHNGDRMHATKGRGPWKIVYVETFSTRSAAMAREREIKRQKSRAYLERILMLEK